MPGENIASNLSDSDCSDDEFHDAEEVTDLIDDEIAIAESKRAIHLLLSNEIGKARDILKEKSNTSMYYALGYSTIMFVEAIMTWDIQGVEIANAALKISCNLSRARQKKASGISNLIGGTPISTMTDGELHAEICQAESLLLRAMATFVEDESLLAFIKGGLKVKECHGIYKACYQFSEKISSSSTLNSTTSSPVKSTTTRQQAKPTGEAHKSNLTKLGDKLGKNLRMSKSPQDKVNNRNAKSDVAELHEEFLAGVRMGYGMFNLMISMLPPKVLKLLEFIGFKGDRELGMSLLQRSGDTDTLRATMSNLSILSYHYVIVRFLNLIKEDLTVADEMLDRYIERYPNGAFFLFYKGRRHLVRREPEKAIEALKASVEVQSEWTQLHHLCYWELMFANACAGDWVQASAYANKLFNDSKWSKCNFKYMEASFWYMALTADGRVVSADEQIDLSKEFEKVSEYKQRIAGKSIPSEKFVIRKARKFKLQNGSLMLPGLEMLVHWNIIQYMNVASLNNTLNVVLQSIGKMQKVFENSQRQKNNSESKPHNRKKNTTSGKLERVAECVVDDLCLCYFLRGCLESALEEYDDAENSFLEVLKYADGIELDHWITPYTTAELSFVYYQTARYKESEATVRRAIDNYKGYSMESRLHFRAHSILRNVRPLAAALK
eukprot:CFRG8040T1